MFKLKVSEHEIKFVASNEISIAQAYIEPRTFPTAIYADNQPVGFLWYGQFSEDNGDWWLGRMMIDKNHRSKGYATDALNQIIGQLKERKVERFYLTVVPTNKQAISFYEKLGFKNTGKVFESEEQYMLQLFN